MVPKTMTPKAHAEALLARLRLQRQLPVVPERRRIRESAGVSLRQLAAAIGVSPMAVMRWEAGSTPRHPEHVQTYGRLLEELQHLVVATAPASSNDKEVNSARRGA